ncbi:anaerobic sulfite reductase subunit B [Salmonella enterica subsp. enterica]|uniref:Anaerobic sulfite reductase subunit B n=1 Tax=Salmonella enterica I TaxID=59201 RepID=A0A3S4JC69_SALET|nr:anaerobic sulfite reductase subunit B [Salmonella enterica subsp. enterica]
MLTLDEGEADDRYQIGRVTDRLADMTLSDIDTMQAIVVGAANNDYLYRKNAAAKKGSSRSKSGWTTNAGWPAPSGSAATAVWAKCMSAPTARYLTTPPRNVLPIKEKHHEH